MMRSLLKRLKFILLFSIPELAFATQKNMGVGDFAGTIIQPVNILNNFIGSASLVIGISCLFGAFFRYMQYRINPLAAPLSSVVVLFVLGLILLGLPFLYLIVSGVPFTLYSRSS